MNERVEAAAKAAHVSKLTGVQWDDMPKWKRIDRINEARAALAAADAVMFSDETLETIYDELRLPPPQMRWLVSALKGAGDE